MNAGRKVEKEGDQELTREPMRVSGFIMMLMGAFAFARFITVGRIKVPLQTLCRASRPGTLSGVALAWQLRNPT